MKQQKNKEIKDLIVRDCIIGKQTFYISCLHM